jgi:imidazolonepropionase-like amidohydrolase
MRRLLPALALTAVTVAASALPAQRLVIRNVTVLPMDREARLPAQTVVVTDGRIAAVTPDAVAPQPGDIAVDGTGKFLMPGIAEMHAHVGSATQNPRILALYALYGVTTTRGMLGAPQHLALRDSLAQGLVLGPRFFTSGPSFNTTTVTSPAQAAARVREQHAAGFDLLKIHPGVPGPAFDSLAAAAHAVGIPFGGHVPLEVGLDGAIRHRFSTIDHLDGFIEAMWPGPRPITAQQTGWFGLNLVPEVDPARMRTLVAQVKQAGIAQVPTQTLMDSYVSDETGEQLAQREEMRYWFADQVANWTTNKNAFLANTPASSAQRAAFTQLRRTLIKALHDEGVLMLLGSDAPQLWNVPGASTHRELQSLVAAGLTPYQALRTGTVNIATFFGETGQSGVVSAGARADLMLLDADPLTDITHSLRINGVVVNGRWIGPEERARRLAEFAASR